MPECDWRTKAKSINTDCGVIRQTTQFFFESTTGSKHLGVCVSGFIAPICCSGWVNLYNEQFKCGGESDRCSESGRVM